MSNQENSPPILTVCPETYPGTTAVLKHYGVTGLVEHTDEISPRTVIGRKMVILGGWTPHYYEAIKKIAGANVPIGMFWTSSVGQNDFSNNGIEVSFIHLITDLLKAEIVQKLFVATPSVKSMYDQIIDPEKVILLPYAYNWDEIQQYLEPDIYVGDNWVDLFCPGDTRKNILVQTHGAKLANAHLHYSGLRHRYRWFADLIKVRYTDMGWMKKPNPYYKAVQTMKLGLQVTYAETFDYVVAEHFGLKRPCLISTVMGQWVDKKLWKDLMVYNLDDPLEVEDKIEHILNMSDKQWKGLNTRCHNFMKQEAKRRNDTATKVLQGVAEE